MSPRTMMLSGPDLGGRVEAAIIELTTRRPMVCPHLDRGDRAAVVCAQHPAAGILCLPCATQHTHRHDEDTEHTCDRCGTVVELIHGVTVPVAGMLAARTTTGYGLLLGELYIGSLGLCCWCAQALEQRHRAVAS